jgi:glyoxylase-like metal-dependent hydrolase (beta-lactamase superfamily II)
MGDSRIEDLYERVRATSPVADSTTQRDLVRVAPGIRVLALRTPTLPPAADTNVYLVGPDAGPVAVVDPGSPYPDQQAILDSVLDTIPVARILLTHHHGDHIGGAAHLAERWGVPIAAHAKTAARLEGTLSINEQLADGDVVHGATCVHTPGHAEGHLVFELGDTAIAGDMVAGIGTILIDPDEGDMGEYLASLERMRSRDERVLLPAHGPPIRDGAAKLTQYLAHRLMREQRVVGALAGAPQSAAQLVETVYSDTPRFLWGLAERSLLAHLAKLVRDGIARSLDGGLWSR